MVSLDSYVSLRPVVLIQRSKGGSGTQYGIEYGIEGQRKSASPIQRGTNEGMIKRMVKCRDSSIQRGDNVGMT